MLSNTALLLFPSTIQYNSNRCSESITAKRHFLHRYRMHCSLFHWPFQETRNWKTSPIHSQRWQRYHDRPHSTQLHGNFKAKPKHWAVNQTSQSGFPCQKKSAAYISVSNFLHCSLHWALDTAHHPHCYNRDMSTIQYRIYALLSIVTEACGTSSSPCRGILISRPADFPWEVPLLYSTILH